MIQRNLEYAVTGQSGAGSVYILEKQIVSLQEEAENLMTMMSTTGGDTEKYVLAIEENFKKIKVLRQQLETEKCKVQVDGQHSALLERMTAMFSSDSISFDEYDDVVVRRLVECVRVMKDKRIVVVLKGGLQAEEMIQV